MYEDQISNAKNNLLEIMKSNATMLEALYAQQTQYVSDCFDRTLEQTKKLSEVKDFNSVISLQSNYATELRDMLVTTAEKNMEVFNRTKADIGSIVEKSAVVNGKG